MKTINLFETTIPVNKNALLNALNRNEEITIHLDGSLNTQGPILYKGVPQLKTTMHDILGNAYTLEEKADAFMLNAAKAWQDIINLNKALMEYDDTSTDGIAEFRTKELEKIGWHATDFDISYREMVDVLEKECEGALLCIESDTNFSGIGFIDDTSHAKEVLFDYCKIKIVDLIAQDDFSKENLTADEKNSARFFGITL